MRESQGGKQIPIQEKYDIRCLNPEMKREKKLFALDPIITGYLKNKVFREFFIDQLEYAKHRFKQDYKPEKDMEGFLLYRKYARKDVFRILGWEQNPVAQNVGGYMIAKDKKDCAIFVNYHKEEDISSTTKYEDQFITPELFQWMSKSRRRMNSKDVTDISNYKKHNMRLPLFLKKHNDEGLEFYYMGDVEPLVDKFKEQEMESDQGKSVSVVKMLVKLKNPVPHEMYEYIIEK